MRNPVPVGTEAEVRFEVRPGMEAAFDGRVVHRVLATWWLVHYMEYAARRVLEPYLAEDEEGAGVGINVRHLGPAPVGERVRVVARATQMEGQKLVCSVFAECSRGPVGEGVVYQAVWPKGALAERMAGRASGRSSQA
ncbi:MAG: hypothetical protein IRZ11_00095 [Clostridia bacterium]|nr:hypothetical protein [Clostridia bacterium]